MVNSTMKQPDPLNGGWVDAHVHLWTADTVRYPLAHGFTRDQMQPQSFIAEDLFLHVKPLGVDRIVLIQMVFYGFDNSLMLDAMRAHPRVFSGVALVDEQCDDPAAEMRQLKKLGVRGVRITPQGGNEASWLDHPGMRAMWKCAADEQMAMGALINPGNLPALDRMCQEFPDTPVVVDHFARIGGDGQIREADLNALCKLAQHRNSHVKLSAFYYLGDKHPPYDDLVPMIRRLHDSFGPQRLMWGSDSPFQLEPPDSYQASLELVRDRLDFLSPSDKLWLLRKTAEKIFFS